MSLYRSFKPPLRRGFFIVWKKRGGKEGTRVKGRGKRGNEGRKGKREEEEQRKRGREGRGEGEARKGRKERRGGGGHHPNRPTDQSSRKKSPYDISYSSRFSIFCRVDS